MSIPRAGSRDISKGLIVSLTPDVCKTPVGSSMVPVPYSITAKQGDDANTAATVRFTKKRAHNMGSLVTKSTGAQPGTGTGVKSGTVGSVCHPKTHSAKVRINGKWAVRDNDTWEMNNRNTLGKLTYLGSTETFRATPAVLLAQNSASALPPGSYQLAQAAPSPSPSNPQPTPNNTPNTRNIPSPGPAANDNEYRPRNNRVARPPASSAGGAGLLRMLGLGAIAAGAGDLAGQWYVGNEGVIARRMSEVLRRDLNPFGDQSAAIFSGRSWSIGREAQINEVNDMLSFKTGRDLDFRTMSPDELAEVIEAPWPSAEQITANRQAVEEQRAQAVESQVTPDNVRVEGEEDEKPDRDCRLRPYSEGCSAPYGTPHHVVADRSFRYPGTNQTYPSGVPHAEGLCICVSNGTPVMRGPNANEHGRIHAIQNAGERALGQAGTPVGTATLGALEDNGVAAAAAVTGCDPVAMKAQLRAYHQGRGLPSSSRWRAGPSGRRSVHGVGIPPISPY